MPRLPSPTELTQPFWDALNEGVLRVQQCGACARHIFVPEPVCTHCGSTDLQWVDSPGRGTIYSMSIVHQTISPDQPVPFVLATVDLDEGWTILTHIVGEGRLDARIGDPVICSPTRVNDAIVLPTFTLRRA